MNKKNVLYFLILTATYSMFIYHSYGLSKEIDLLDLFMKIFVAVIIFILIIRIQSYTFSKEAYDFFNIGLMLRFFAQATDIMYEICKYPKIIKNIFEGFTEAVSFCFLLAGAHLTIKNIQKLEKLSTVDELTNTSNRYELIRRFYLLKNISDRNGNAVTIISFDVDHFKKINDTYGHLTGDSVLKELSLLVSTNLRSQDIFGRYGGEEFLVLLPETDIKGGIALAEKLRGIIEKFEFKEVSRVTASFGVSQYRKYEDINQILSRVDKALYFSKNRGRNCVSSEVCKMPSLEAV